MVFNSLTFLTLFLPTVLVLYRLPAPWRARKIFLLAASWGFYAAFNVVHLPLLVLSTFFAWFSAEIILAGHRRAGLALNVAGNIGMLVYFRYLGFLCDTFVRAASLGGRHLELHPPSVLLPIGVSFFAFHSISHAVDVYRGAKNLNDSILDVALYVGFFPQLVAGPILRAAAFIPQCKKAPVVTTDDLVGGLALLVVGLFQKVILADAVLAPVVDEVFWSAGGLSAAQAWLGVTGFSAQIFFDFAGYSTCAIGLARCFGFSLPDNFRSPYAARGFRDFWQRWHVSLSTWIRDYLFLSLTLSSLRKHTADDRRATPTSSSARTVWNVMLTMALSGLWHGAGWTFVAWGMLHGAYLIGEHVVARVLPPAIARWQLVGTLVTYALTCLAWLLFRAPDFSTAMKLLGAMFGGHVGPAHDFGPVMVEGAVATIVGMLVWQQLARLREEETQVLPRYAQAVLLGVAMFLVLTHIPGTARAFIYFQF